MNSTTLPSRKQLSTPIKSVAAAPYNLRSESKAKLPVLSQTATTIQAASTSPFGQPVEILPSK